MSALDEFVKHHCPSCATWGAVECNCGLSEAAAELAELRLALDEAWANEQYIYLNAGKIDEFTPWPEIFLITSNIYKRAFAWLEKWKEKE